MVVSPQVVNLKKEVEAIKKKQLQILEMKTIITEMMI